MAEGVSSSPGRSTRMSRNAACTHCRTSKVRCNPSSIVGRPCQRCTKLNLSCVVNPTCRRTTRKSQLDQLAREVQAIRETVVVDSSNIARQPALQTPSSPSTWSPRVQGANEASSSSVTPAFSATASEHNSRHGDNAVVVVDNDTQVDSTAVPSVHRALNSQPFTGPEIDEHFNIYFRYFHPHFPILSQRDPNKCYDTSPFLFWVIVLISCRRQPTHNPATIRLLAEHVKHETDATVPKVPQPLAQLHAILLVAAWGLYPGVRFINDPAYWLSGIAINSCLLLGFHTASGRHPEYNHVTLGTISSDIEAAVTWAASTIVNRRLSTNLGLPCTAPMNKATLNMIHDEGSLLPFSLRIQLECQVFMDRVNKTLGSSLEESNGVPCELVRMFEDEWVAARARSISKHTDPVLSLHTLFVLLEVQMYYFLLMPTQNSQSSTTISSLSGRDNLSPSIEADILRCYTTASIVITRVMDLDMTTDLLHYLPHYTIRPIAHAITVIFRVIRSDLPLRYLQIVVPEEASKLSAHTITISRRISAVEGDLAWRLARCVELWETTSAPYIAAAAASRFNVPAGNDDENNNNSDQAASAGASPEYEPVLVKMFRQRMVAALGWDFMIRWKSKHGPVHMGPYKPQPQTQTMGMHVGVGEASNHTQHQQQTPSASSTGTSGPDGGPTRFQAVQQDQQLFQSQQQQQQQLQQQLQQQTGIPGNFSSATIPSGETEPSLPSTGTMGTASLLGADWGFLDDFIWGFDSQDP